MPERTRDIGEGKNSQMETGRESLREPVGAEDGDETMPSWRRSQLKLGVDCAAERILTLSTPH